MVRLLPLLLLVGCSSGDRCRDLMLDDLAYRHSVELEDSVGTHAARILRGRDWPFARLDSLTRVIRYNLVATDKRDLGLTPLPSDSLFRVVLPPSPADTRWYAEHCYAGHALD